MLAVDKNSVMKVLILALFLNALFGCASSQDKAVQQEMDREQIQRAIKKIEIECRDQYPNNVAGAFLKRKQCQEMRIQSLPLPQH